MRFGPAVRLLIHQHNLNPAAITATGPRGTLLKSDVLAALASSQAKSQPSPAAPPAAQAASPTTLAQPKPSASRSPYNDILLSAALKQAGSSLVTAKFAMPHAYQTVDVNLGSFDKLIRPLVTKSSPPDWIHYLRVACLVKCTAKAVARGALLLTTSSPHNNNVAVAFPKADDSSSETFKTLVNASKLNVADIATFLQNNGEGNLKVGNDNSTASISFHSSLPEPVVLRRFLSVVRPPQIAAISVSRLPLEFTPLQLVEDDSKSRKVVKMQPVYSVTMSYDCATIDDTVAAAFLAVISENVQSFGL